MQYESKRNKKKVNSFKIEWKKKKLRKQKWNKDKKKWHNNFFINCDWMMKNKWKWDSMFNQTKWKEKW